MKLKFDESNPMLYKESIDNLKRVWKRSIEAFQALEKVLSSVELKKHDQFVCPERLRGCNLSLQPGGGKKKFLKSI